MSELNQENRWPLVASYGSCILPGKYHLHSRFSKVVNYYREESLISIVTPTTGPGPYNIELAEASIPRSNFIDVFSEEVHFSHQRFSLEESRKYNGLINITAEKQVFDRNVELLKTVLCCFAPKESLAFLVDTARQFKFSRAISRSLCTRFNRSYRLLQSGSIDAGIRLIRGVGIGLTPSGDDFICGIFWALHFIEYFSGQSQVDLKSSIWERSNTHNLISKWQMISARDGHFSGNVKMLFEAMMGKEKELVVAAALKLFQMGSTSGADAATGFILTMDPNGWLYQNQLARVTNQ